MYIEIQKRWGSISVFGLILCFLVIFVVGGCTTRRRVIKNETLDVWDGRRTCYKNLFSPKYSMGQETDFDRIDFLEPYERKPHTYRLLSNPKGGDIDRTLGYDPSEYTVEPDLNSLQNPTHDIQITWLRHAAFLVQIGGTYQILIDPFLGDLTLHFLPANHGSGRSMNKRNQTLWGGWLFDWQGYRIYFAGDSGYSDVFKDIKSRLGAVDICLMPIASWYWRHRHFTPEDAIEAAEDLGCKVFIPWGWGTWIISMEHILEPPRRLQYAWDQRLPDHMELRMLKMGETYLIDVAGQDPCRDCK